MDPNTVAARLHRSREQLRAILLAGQPGYENADVFPRSRTMRFLFDPARRGMATAAFGSLASLAFGRMQRRERKNPGLIRTLIGLFRTRP